jgi:hypothetical protein
MVGKDPFQTGANAIVLKESLRAAVCKCRFTEDKRASTWRCPAQTQGRYVRVQLETYNSLSIAEVEVAYCRGSLSCLFHSFFSAQVFGYWGLSKGVGRVSFAAAGRPPADLT